MRLALTGGLSRRRVANDLGVGLSTLNKQGKAHRDTDVVSTEDRELARKNERLRREIRILKKERDIPGRATQFFASQMPCRARHGGRYHFVDKSSFIAAMSGICLAGSFFGLAVPSSSAFT